MMRIWWVLEMKTKIELLFYPAAVSLRIHDNMETFCIYVLYFSPSLYYHYLLLLELVIDRILLVLMNIFTASVSYVSCLPMQI